MSLTLPELHGLDPAQALYESILELTTAPGCKKWELNERQLVVLPEGSSLKEALQYLLGQHVKRITGKYVAVLNGIVDTHTCMHGAVIVSAHIEPQQEGISYSIDDAVSYTQNGKTILAQGGIYLTDPDICMDHCTVIEVI